MNDALLAELQHELATTRTCLERVPTETFDWKPHEKSFSMGKLTSHIAEMCNWLKTTLETDELDFSTGEYTPFEANSSEELLQFFDAGVATATESLKNISDEELFKHWKMRNGDEVYFDMPRIQVLRGFIFSHMIHHRGQLSVYLRLNDIPVPSIYGPSADEGTM